MKVKLSDGVNDVNVGVSHIKLEDGRRGTKVWVRMDGFVSEATALCSLEDNFSKKVGRKLAATRLLANLSIFSRNDRGIIFRAICPDLKG